MKLCIISDTHTKHKKLIIPECDVLIHCGDFTSVGYEYETRNFMEWFSSLRQCKHKICIAGNHDLIFERNAQLVKSLIPENVIYLQDSEIVIDGIKFYGTPYQPEFFPEHWAFNKNPEKLKLIYGMIPNDVDVLITHCPPRFTLDKNSHGDNCGSYELLEAISKRKIKLNVFGHIHQGYGIETEHGKTFINASVLDDRYYLVNEPVTYNLNL